MESKYVPSPDAVPVTSLSVGDRFRYSNEHNAVYLVVAHGATGELFALNTNDHHFLPLNAGRDKVEPLT